jgi:flagellar biosynthesis/type III secretory pathway M-ring protein FliF/YscJ
MPPEVDAIISELKQKIQALEEKVNTTFSNIQNTVTTYWTDLKKLRGRQLYTFIGIAAVVVMVIIAFFLVKGSFGKTTVDRSLIDSLEAQRRQIVIQREQMHQELEEYKRKDSILFNEILVQQASIRNINNKLQILDNEYKHIPDYNSYSSDELKKFFSDLR